MVGEFVQELEDSKPPIFPSGNESDGRSRSRSPAQTEEAIQVWLISQLSEQLEVKPDDIDIGESLARYGLDSSVAISITANLEDWLGCKLGASLLWDYPSIEALARHLAKKCRLLQSNSKVSESEKSCNGVNC